VNRTDGLFGIEANVTNELEAKHLITETLKYCQKLDMLVCNVGSGRSVMPGKEYFDEWQRVINLNLLSATNVIEAAHDALEKTEGSIVCISSICGQETVPGAPITYTVAKAALNSYVRAISKPLGNKGVRINAVAPGNIIFKDSVWEKKLAENQAAVEQLLQREVALHRLGTPEDVAEIACYLLSEKARFITGGIFTVDGGQIRS
jgi:NAD(P)-dependent dehydrogenase (short-subunit alcohol dehydrogenase family)